MRKKRMIIFSPGPANISERVRRALLKPDICHRDSEFTAILKDVRRLICLVCGVKDGYESVIFTGSGTAAIEASISSLRGISKRLLVISNGLYGERAYDIARIHMLSVKKIKFPYNEKPGLSKIEKEIKDYRPNAIYVVHHETTAGLLNPLDKIGRLAKRYNVLLMVDGVSSIAGERIAVKEWGIDILIGSANKCIRGVAGLSFTVLSPRFIEMLKNSNTDSYYLNLKDHLLKEKEGQTPFTPAVHSFYAFQEALKELIKEGVGRRIRHYKNISSLLREGIRKMGLDIYVDDHAASATMNTIMLPDGIDYKWLHRECKKKGYVIYAAMGPLKNKAFRLGTVGCISQKDITDFIKVLRNIISRKKGCDL